ncbi:MAG: aminomethyl transferase family protein [Phycisphaerales bacterium]|nr:MAG: aminomethyl transferase family protein [Phycisphaerales bacterium]
MPRVSPIRQRHLEAEASLLPYGPENSPVELVETFGELELEYAAVRKFAALLDLPSRALVRVRGADRLDFLNRMLTRELLGKAPLTPHHTRRSFWLNRKGRIDADLRLIELDDHTLLELDTFSVEHTIETLTNFVFTEDVAFEDATPELHRLALHGPNAFELLQHLATHARGVPLAELNNADVSEIEIDGIPVTVFREDTAGVPGLELITPAERTSEVYAKLCDAGQPLDDDGRMASVHANADTLAARVRLRPIGWHAYNIARIEAGTPLFMLDFGPTNLPAETGVLNDRVNFDKGCYLGQEVVARMHSLGKPKQVLVALKLQGQHARDAQGHARQAVTGAQVFLTGDAGGDVIGAVTSSTISPMLGASAIAFAMVKTKHAEPGQKLTVAAEGEFVEAEVQPALRTLP